MPLVGWQALRDVVGRARCKKFHLVVIGQSNRCLVKPGADIVQCMDLSTIFTYITERGKQRDVSSHLEGSIGDCCSRYKKTSGSTALIDYAVVPHNAYSSVTEANFSVMFWSN